MLSPVVQKLVGAAASSVCALAITAIVGGIVMYGQVQRIHERLDGDDARMAAMQSDITYLSRRLTTHQIGHE